MYKIVLQNISKMQQINGMEKDGSFKSELENLIIRFKAFRCYYIALTLIEMRKWKEAVAMYEGKKEKTATDEKKIELIN